jgi:TPR repeat protein
MENINMKQALRILFLTVFVAAAAVAEDEPAGLSVLRAQAEAGSAEAQVELGILYEYGFRMPDNLVPALAWYMRAAESGSTGAVHRRDALAARLTAAQVDEAKRLAAEITAKRPETPLAPAPAPAPSAPEAAPVPVLAPAPASEPPKTAAPAEQPMAPIPTESPTATPAPAGQGAAPAEPQVDTKKLF